MLIRFNVSNFLSFNEMQEFSMIGGKVRSKPDHISDDKKLKLLKFAAVYGANASGKSNLISAMAFSRTMVTSGFPEGHTNKYHKTRKENKSKPSYFEFEIKLNNRYYAYGFEVILSQSSIVSEWLMELSPDGNDKKIFTRDVANEAYSIGSYFKNKKNNERLNIYAQDIKTDDSVLFLNVMNKNKPDLYTDNDELSVLKDVYGWIKHQLNINYPGRPISDYSYFTTEKNTDEICSIINAFGTGISKFRVIDMSMDKIPKSLPKPILKSVISKLESMNKTLKNNKDDKTKSNKPMGILLRGDKDIFIFNLNDGEISIKTIEFEHTNSDALFTLSEESDGTIRLLDLIEVLLSGNDDKVFVIDEIDRCLHPQLTYKLIETYLQISKNSHRQLIVTTHESTLLDFELLRRDEIWFVDKNNDGESSLYSLEAYNERFDKKIDKAYLEGRYRGVPVFSSVFPVKGE